MSASQARRRVAASWTTDEEAAVGTALRTLCNRPWLTSGRDDAVLQLVRTHQERLQQIFGSIGWSLTVERTHARLFKRPTAPLAPVTSVAPESYPWFFLLLAACETVPTQVEIHQLLDATFAAAAEAGLESTGHISERRALVSALRMLEERGIVELLRGDLDGYVDNAEAPVHLRVFHAKLAHAITRHAARASDPDTWFAHASAEPDVRRRVLARLIDSPALYFHELDAEERAWLFSSTGRKHIAQVAGWFGLDVEVRAEGMAYVVPEDSYRYERELGPHPFPTSGGTVPHAALLLCDYAASAGTPDDEQGPGWLRISRAELRAHLSVLAEAMGTGRGAWSSELSSNLDVLLQRVLEVLRGRDLVRVRAVAAGPESTNLEETWSFSPVAGRWPAPSKTSTGGQK